MLPYLLKANKKEKQTFLANKKGCNRRSLFEYLK